MGKLRLLVAAKSAFIRTLPLMRDSRVPIALKAFTVAAAALIVSPLDIFGDLPVLGLLDDAALLALLCYAFVHFASRHTRLVPVGSSVAKR